MKSFHGNQSVTTPVVRFKPASEQPFFLSGPTTDTPSRKESAIVQQTIWITDNVATCIIVHTIDLHYTIVLAVEH